MQRNIKIILIVAILLIFAGLFIFGNNHTSQDGTYQTLANESIGTVEKCVYGNEKAATSIAVITGIHPREPLSIEPVIKAVKEFANDDVKIIHYKVTVTDHPQDYKIGRDNGEKLIHDHVNPDVTKSDAGAVIISHSHIPEYGQGFYLATPEMDNASVKIAEKVKNESDFNYYPVTGQETYKSTSAVLVSKPIAQAGYPTLVYEMPEDITNDTATSKTKELFEMVSRIISK